MPPPAVSVDSRSPSNASFNFNFKSQNGPSFGPPTHPNDYSYSFNTGLDPSSTSFLAGSQASSVRPKPKPRLVKQRRSAKSAAVAQAHAFVDLGINPFRSVSDTSNCCSNSNEFVNSGFVFGVSNSSSDVNCNSNNKVGDDSKLAGNASGFGVRDSANVDSVNKDCDLQKQEFNFSEIDKSRGIDDSTEGVTFRFGALANDRVGVSDVKCGEKLDEFELLDEMNKLNIGNVEKGSCREGENSHGLDNGDVSKGGDHFFVFKTSGASSGSTVPVEGDRDARNLNGLSEGKKNGFGSQDVDDVFVFGSSGKFTQPGDSSSQSPAFPAENEGSSVKEELLSSSFSISSLDAEVGTAKPDACSSMGEKKEFSSSCMPEGSGGSFSDFELPHFDAPMSFSANISSGLGRKPESSLRHRGLKDRNLKRTKGKSKQSKNIKLQPAQIPVSSEYVTQGPEAPECYSPMDFSPYEDTSNTSVPLSDPQASAAVRTDLQLNDTGTDFNAKMNGHGGDANPLSFSSDKTSRGEEKFTFTSSTSSQNHVSSSKRIQRRKYRMKNPAFISSDPSKVQGSSQEGTPLLSKLQGVGGNISASVRKDKHKTEADDELGCEAYSDAEKACEKWRRRGNEAYEKGELSKAEDFYKWGVNCVPPSNASIVAFRPLVRCHSNRAATRMALGRLREAIQDCLMAVKLDPTFHRAQIRAANCYLQLGEVEDAMQCFNKCLGSGNVVYLDRQVVISASEGIQKSQKVIECSSRSAELLKCRTSDAATDALQYISEAMSISIYSERLFELKAQALCMLSRHEEVITLCQKTLDFAERNFTDSIPRYHEVDASSNIRLWRYHMSAKCHFHLGNLEKALDFLKKQEFWNKTQELSDPLAVSIHELLKQKNAGNTAFRSEKHVEAIEHYTSAIYNSMESRPFAAICFCNRAAAYQALGQITDAISDCSLAIALDENYAKAVSRRATLHEMIRDYKQAVADLQKLFSLQKQSLEKSEHSGSGKGKELRQLQQRLSVMEEEAKKDTPLDLYLILIDNHCLFFHSFSLDVDFWCFISNIQFHCRGTKKFDSVSEIKKAYRKAALRHHPDKAAQSLVRSGEVGEEGHHWKDIAELVYKDSDRLFKMIGEAYAVLSDPTKREEYDLDEDMRKALKESNNIRSNSRRYSEDYNKGYPFERSSSRRYWQDSYRTYGQSHRR